MGSTPGLSGSFTRYSYTNKGFSFSYDNAACEQHFLGGSLTTQNSTKGETPVQPTTYSGIYGGGGAGGSGGGAPGLRPPGWIGSSVNKTNANAGENPNTWFSVKGQGGPGGLTIHGGGSGGTGNSGYAHTSNADPSTLTTWGGGTYGEGGYGKGGAIAIINRGVDTKLTLQGVDFFNNVSYGREDPDSGWGLWKGPAGNNIYAETNKNLEKAKVFIYDTYSEVDQQHKALVTLTSDGDVESTFMPGYQLFNTGGKSISNDPDQPKDGVLEGAQYIQLTKDQVINNDDAKPYLYGVSTPRVKTVADIRDYNLRGIDGRSDVFVISVEDSSNWVGVTSNFNDPQNPFNKLWRAVNPDQSSKLQKQLSEVQAKQFAAEHSHARIGDVLKNIFNPESIAKGITGAAMGSFCSWGAIGCAGINVVEDNLNSYIFDGLGGQSSDYANTIQELQGKLDDNNKKQADLKKYLRENSAATIGSVNITKERSPVVIENFELGKDTLSIPSIDDHGIILLNQQVDGNDRSKDILSFSYDKQNNDLAGFLKLQLSDSSYDKAASNNVDWKSLVTQMFIKTDTDWTLTNRNLQKITIKRPGVRDGTLVGDTIHVDRSDNNFIPKDDPAKIYSYGGDDYLIGSNGNELLVAGEGDDIVLPGFGEDTVSGGYGIDSVSYAVTKQAVSIKPSDVENTLSVSKINTSTDVTEKKRVSSNSVRRLKRNLESNVISLPSKKTSLNENLSVNFERKDSWVGSTIVGLSIENISNETLKPGWSVSFTSDSEPKDSYFSNIQLEKKQISDDKWQVILTAPNDLNNSSLEQGFTLQGEFQLSDDFQSTSDLNLHLSDLSIKTSISDPLQESPDENINTSQPADSNNPSQQDPVDNTPADSNNPSQQDPVDNTPADSNNPSQQDPVDNTPADSNNPSQQDPVDNTPADSNNPSQQDPVDNTPADSNNPSQQDPVDNTPADSNNPSQQDPVDNTPASSDTSTADPEQVSLPPSWVQESELNTSINSVETFELWSKSSVDLSDYQNIDQDNNLLPILVKAGAGSTIVGSKADDKFVISHKKAYNSEDAIQNGSVYDLKTVVRGNEGWNKLIFNLEDAPSGTNFTFKKIANTEYQIFNGDSMIIDAYDVDKVVKNWTDGDDYISGDSSNEKGRVAQKSVKHKMRAQKQTTKSELVQATSFVHDLGDGDDYFKVDANEQKVFGGKGDDMLIGQGANELLIGEKGDDTIVTKGRFDLAVGGRGDDLLVAKGKQNYLVGGAGDNVYDLSKSKGKSYVIVRNGNDSIQSFDPEMDKIVFSGVKRDSLKIARNNRDLKSLMDDQKIKIISHNGKIYYKNKRRHSYSVVNVNILGNETLDENSILNRRQFTDKSHQEWVYEMSDYI
ncbi:hypothetical protein [Synechococcus sp. MIT S1220]|uniref:hypothetical protein n=1 Tax=Synechococcus sp. MIT S1220 TaxID=3082549 RepID=UPI0039AE9C57